MQSKRVVFLDAGGTLIHLDRGFLLDALKQEGIDKDEVAFLVADRTAREHRSQALRSHGESIDDATSWRIYAARLLEVLECTGSAAARVASQVKERHRAGKLWTHVEAGTEDTLAQLKDMGYTIGVISNADGRVDSFLEHAGLKQYLNFVVDSGTVGIEKPDRRIFELGLERAGAQAEEAVHVGDVYEVDVVGARGAGIDAVLLITDGSDAPSDVTVIRSLPELIGRLPAPR